MKCPARGFKIHTHDVGWVRQTIGYSIIISIRPSIATIYGHFEILHTHDTLKRMRAQTHTLAYYYVFYHVLRNCDSRTSAVHTDRSDAQYDIII